MAKPIFIIEIPIRNCADKKTIEKAANNVKDSIGDEYYVLAFQTEVEEVKFEVFYEKDFNEVKFEELKQIVKKRLKLTDKKKEYICIEVNETLHSFKEENKCNHLINNRCTFKDKCNFKREKG